MTSETNGTRGLSQRELLLEMREELRAFNAKLEEHMVVAAHPNAVRRGELYTALIANFATTIGIVIAFFVRFSS